MKIVVDRLVQYPNRFRLVNVSTGEVLGVFDLSAVTGTIQQVGTEIDAELFQTIQEDLTNLAQDIVAESNARGVDVSALQNSIATKITANGGELGNAVVSFTEISNATNIASGETASTLFGKIKNWFSRLKALAFKDTITDSDISSSANISQSKVSGLTAIQSKLNGIDVGANKYTLPTATATALGGVKVGSRLSVATDGTISADVQSDTNFTQNEKSKLNGIESGANNYILPNATANTLGGVKVGDRLSIVDGVLSANLQSDANFTQEEKTKLSDLSNPNLLINSDFSINQRGLTEYENTGTTNIYGVDRWLIGIGANIKAVKTTVNSAGITVSKEATTTGGYYFLFQDVEDYAKLAGKKLTVTVAYKNNTGSFRIQCNDGITSYNSSAFTNTSGTATFTFTVSSAPTQLRIRLQDQTPNAMSIEFEYVKLELGSIATAYTPPVYEEEIWKCNSAYGKDVSIYRPNLLINSNFAINQRGIYADNTTTGYMVDRWYKAVGTAASVSFSGEECTIELLSNRTSRVPVLRQVIEDGYKYIGKSLTLSLDVVSTTSTYYISIVYYNENGAYITESSKAMTAGSIGRVSVTTNSVPVNTYTIRVTINAYEYGLDGDVIIFKYPKLELGSVATAYVPPNIPEELVKCQRYYLELPIDTTGFRSTTTSILFFKQLPNSIRSAYTIMSVYASSYSRIIGETAGVFNVALENFATASTVRGIQITYTDETANYTDFLFVPVLLKLIIDAEIY